MAIKKIVSALLITVVALTAAACSEGGKPYSDDADFSSVEAPSFPEDAIESEIPEVSEEISDEVSKEEPALEDEADVSEEEPIIEKSAPSSGEIELKINDDIISDLGLTYAQLIEKRGEPISIFNGCGFEKGYGRYYYEGAEYGGELSEESVEKCCIVDGINASDLFIGITFPMYFDKLEQIYEIKLIEQEERENTLGSLYWSLFSCGEITIVPATTERGVIDIDTSLIVKTSPSF